MPGIFCWGVGFPLALLSEVCAVITALDLIFEDQWNPYSATAAGIFGFVAVVAFALATGLRKTAS